MQANNANKMKRLIDGRVKFVGLLFGVLLFIWPIVKLYQIQIVQHDFYTRKAEEQQTGDTKITAKRGTIYDRNGETLAQSIDVDTVVINPKQIHSEQERELLARGLSDILGVDYDDVITKSKKNSGNEYIKRKIDAETKNKVLAFKKEHKIECLNTVPDTLRVYRYNNFASHVLGFVGTDNNGLMGIEMLYDDVLTGTAGKIVTARDASGKTVPFQYEKYYDAKDGANVVLTIDATIQHFLEKALEQAVVDNDVHQRAQGIVYDVTTGEVLAMATKGDFDLNKPFELTDQSVIDKLDALDGDARTDALIKAREAMWRNKSVNDTYEPGSVFKIITTAIGLDTGAVKETDEFDCKGSLMIANYDKPIGCWKTAGHGHETFVQGVQNSCNPVFMLTGQRIGGDKFYEYMEAFGLMDKTGIDLQGESGSITVSKQVIQRPLELSISAFGQTNKFTPIQMMAAIGAVANGGKLMKPHIVKETRGADGQLIEEFAPQMVRQVISEETAKRTCEILETVVTVGTGKNAYIKGFHVAGKTGTSEKTDLRGPDGQLLKNSGKYVVSFLAFAPADNPRIAVLITLDEPEPPGAFNLRTGGRMAAPVARQVLEDTLPYLGIEREYSEDDLVGLNINVPNLKELTLNEAKAELDKKKLKYRIVGDADKVTDQIPAAGALVPNTAEVILYMGEEKPTALVKVPDLVGMTLEEANAALSEVNLYLRPEGTVGVAGSKIVADKQSVAKQTEVEEGTVIQVDFIDENAMH